ncbi:MAG: ABC transporter ATP-binding protein [Clostridiales bacterium]|nr:ABC transporter ATP-binding protein [Clostridiales bacterium]
MTENYLEIHNVKKSFSNFILSDISFSLPKGFIMGLIGSNGAGKTTMIKLILNMLEKEQGKIEVFGRDNVNNEKEIKQNIGVVFDSNFFVDTWTVKETEKAISIFYNEWNHKVFQDMIEKFRLADNIKIGDFSRGMQIKLMLACAFSHNAKLLILDEPTSSLDAAARNEFLEILQDYIKDGERSVLFSTHITTDLEQVADYITYLERGKLIYTGSTEELLQKYVIIKGAPNQMTDDLKKHILGIRQTNMGFEGLVAAETARKYKGKYILDIPTIDEIIIHINKEVR